MEWKREGVMFIFLLILAFRLRPERFFYEMKSPSAAIAAEGFAYIWCSSAPLSTTRIPISPG